MSTTEQDKLAQQPISFEQPESAEASGASQPQTPPPQQTQLAMLLKQMIMQRAGRNPAGMGQMAVQPPVPLQRRILHFLLRGLLHLMLFIAALVALVAYEHFRLVGQARVSFGCLVAAAAFGFIPLHDITSLLFSIKRAVTGVVCAFGGFTMIGMFSGGVLSGEPVLKHLAQLQGHSVETIASMLSPGSRNAFRSFATALPDALRLVKPAALTSPQDTRQAAAKLMFLMGKAQEVARTELGKGSRQGEIGRMATRASLALGLDTIDQAIRQLSGYPSSSRLLPGLRAQLAKARLSLRESPTSP